MNREVIVVRTGTANLASVVAALRRLDCEPRVGADADEIEEAELLVLPGVGTVASAMQRLREDGLVEPLRRRIAEGLPTLAICLGMQLLFERSEENPSDAGLGLLPGTIGRFPAGVRVPHMGWNFIEAAKGCRLLKSGYAYFANSYRLSEIPAGWGAALCDYDGKFVAAIERENILACQFHPELSGEFGLDLIARWLAAAGAE